MSNEEKEDYSQNEEEQLKKEIRARVDADIQREETVLVTGYLYKLEGTDGFFYYGSTTQTLHDRFRGHRDVQYLDHDKQQRVTQHFAALGWDQVSILLVREMKSTIKELRIAEGELIKKDFGDPRCLNERITGRYETRRQRFERVYAEELSIKVTCTCDLVVIQAAMKYHLQSQRHKEHYIMKTLPPSPLETRDLDMIVCECGMNIRRYNIEYHLATPTHLLKMQIKLMPPQRKINKPDISKTWEGENGTIYCHCRCGSIVSWHNFYAHLKSDKHFKCAMEIHLYPTPEVTFPERDPSIPEGKKKCSCGLIISIMKCQDHIESIQHKSRLRELASTLPPDDPRLQVTAKDPNHYVPKKRSGDLVECTCHITVCSAGLERHMETQRHKMRMSYIERGLPIPASGKARVNEKIHCGCGVTHSRGNTAAHQRSPGHIKWIREQELEKEEHEREREEALKEQQEVIQQTPVKPEEPYVPLEERIQEVD